MKHLIKITAATVLTIGTLAASTLSAAATETLNFTMGSISGSMYAIGVQVGEELKKEDDINVNVKSGGAVGNVILVSRDKAQFGHSSSGMAFAARQGMEPFDEPMDNVYGLAKVMESTFQLVLLESVPVNSLAELKEEQYPLRLAVGPKGRELELLSRRVLEANGITYDDIRDWGGRVEFVSISDANSLIRDGHLDGVTMLSGLPYAAIVEINAAREMKLLSLSDETIDVLGDKYGYIASKIPAGTYEGIDTPTSTVAGGVILLTNDAVSEETAYEMTKALCSDAARKRLASLSNSIKTYLVSAKACASGVGIPLHPGAEKFFREVSATE
ncbi:TAXI family TRAP transporter solute-binding subunit [uncultured Martelella sp.]|uniref:TAXI family TRAP transporter solute-binding subunit n=1 Tax=uncultured Martelella sp. TaxID=392331 RepID=UPI0029C7735E|nr:TAXI family TRAP transporter solute-binding subunit [uncultured Martelella sp.]